MDLRRLRAGEWLAGLSGLVLLVALFLPWYSDDAGPRTGWESLGALDVVLAVVALSALAIPLVTALQRVPAVPLAHQSLTSRGRLAVPLVLIRVLKCPTGPTGASGAVGGAAATWVSPPAAGWHA